MIICLRDYPFPALHISIRITKRFEISLELQWIM